MKKLLFLSALLLALAGPARAQVNPLPVAVPEQTASGSDLVVVRVYEGDAKVRVVVMRGPAQVQQFEFENGTGEKELFMTSQGYYRLFTALYQEGYVLHSTFGSPRNSNGLVTLLFVKKP